MHHGRIVKRTGDGVLIEFRSVVDAVRCAIEVQNGMIERNAGLPPERRIEFAARLEGIADPGVSVFPTTPTAKYVIGSGKALLISGRRTSRTSLAQCASMQSRPA